MKAMRLITGIIMIVALWGYAHAAIICWEDWEDGGDPDCCIWGDPLPYTFLVDGDMAMDPNGDGWCPSGYFACNSFSTWDAGSCFSLDFQTNVFAQPRQFHFQFIEVGLGSGWKTTGDCAYDMV